MPRGRRRVEAFGLSFLDCICCGFGAVLLVYVLLSAESALAVMDRAEELTAEVNRLEEEVRTGTRDLVTLRNTLEETQSETASAEARSKQILAELESRREQVSTFDAASLARREHIEQLKSDLRQLEEDVKRLKGGSLDEGPAGQELRAFRRSGGDRRYITGVRMRGTRILILVDRSASMMHQDLVNIIKLRNSPVAERRAAAKWRRALETVSWLTTQLPAGSRYQIMSFNTTARPVLPATAGDWLDSGDVETLARALEAVQALTPAEGTNLAQAFIETRKMKPAPDQIVLITDGLPTQGTAPSSRRYISADARARLFDNAISVVPDRVPVDIVLLPLEGEPAAAHRYWRLARNTGGTLLMPSKDWP